MKKLFLAPFLVLILSCNTKLPCKVKRVIDGDTIELYGNPKKIRLKNVDCCEASQPFGAEAKAFTDSVLRSGKVEIITKGKDKYKRTLAEVLVNGNSLNRMLVENGLAWCYPEYDPSSYISLQWKARHLKMGIWGSNNYISPREFRKLKK